MAHGKSRLWRLMLVDQASVVWAMTSERTSAESLKEFVEKGSWGDGGNSGGKAEIPYNPKILEAIHKSGKFFGGS